MMHNPSDTAGESDRARRLAELSVRYRTPLLRYFGARARRQADVEDMVQEVFIRLAAHGLDEVRTEENYLFTTAANVLRDSSRRDEVRLRGSHVSLEDCAPPRDDTSPEAACADRERLRRAILSIHELPMRTQVIFALHRYEELSHPQIAQRLGISTSAVEKHIMKAVAHLARSIGR
jgi:RNA polymerase sigma-70 factor (ECF subfamily)